MRSIERRFKEMTQKHPEHSSFVQFGHAIKGQKITREMISKWFSKLVDKSDYDKKDRRVLLDHFETLTNSENDLRTPDFS